MIDAICENMYAHYLSFGSVRSGVCHDEPDVKWVHSGGPLFNRVFGASFEAKEVNERVAQVTNLARAWQVPVIWLTDPRSAPADLIARLENSGWSNRNGAGQEPPTWTGMAMNLDHPVVEVPWPSGLSVRQVDDEESLRVWASVAHKWASGPDWTQALAVISEMGVGGDRPWVYYTGFLDDEPVATSMLFMGAGVAGLYWIKAMPEARGRGIGTAITRYALDQARRLGHRSAVLQATKLGEGIYRRLGFQEYCKIGLLVMMP